MTTRPPFAPRKHSSLPGLQFTVISRQYEALNTFFIGEDLFRSVWFAFVKLQQFPGDMVCSLCRPYPDTVI